jgi:hypothetical protein
MMEEEINKDRISSRRKGGGRDINTEILNI